MKKTYLILLVGAGLVFSASFVQAFDRLSDISITFSEGRITARKRSDIFRYTDGKPFYDAPQTASCIFVKDLITNRSWFTHKNVVYKQRGYEYVLHFTVGSPEESFRGGVMKAHREELEAAIKRYQAKQALKKLVQTGSLAIELLPRLP